MATAEVAQPLEHSYAIPDPLPPGNYVAKQLRFVNEDSTNLFPTSAGSQRSYDKYASMTMQDFNIKDFKGVDPDYDDLVSTCTYKMLVILVFPDFDFMAYLLLYITVKNGMIIIIKLLQNNI
jgi:hypothetical protein